MTATTLQIVHLQKSSPDPRRRDQSSLSFRRQRSSCLYSQFSIARPPCSLRASISSSIIDCSSCSSLFLQCLAGFITELIGSATLWAEYSLAISSRFFYRRRFSSGEKRFWEIFCLPVCFIKTSAVCFKQAITYFCWS